MRNNNPISGNPYSAATSYELLVSWLVMPTMTMNFSKIGIQGYSLGSLHLNSEEFVWTSADKARCTKGSSMLWGLDPSIFTILRVFRFEILPRFLTFSCIGVFATTSHVLSLSAITV